MVNHHVLLVAYPVQGNINPALQFAERLMRMGIQVTFATILHSLKKASEITVGLILADIRDVPEGFDANKLNTIRDVVRVSRENGRPVTLVAYTTILSWAAEVARQLHIPSALLWTQPATVFGVYYFYFDGYEDDIKNLSSEPSCLIQFPGLPPLSRFEVPSNILPSSSTANNSDLGTSDANDLLLGMFNQQFKQPDLEERSVVLVNTFDVLEPEALNAIAKYNVVAVGPLVSSTSSSCEGEPRRPSFHKDYIEWLCSMPKASVVYVSFGSVITPPMPQMEEIARALLQSGRPFLWVIREMEKVKLSCLDQLQQKGMIVPWCSQFQVLRNPSLGCFITHCEWNSTLESIVFGVPLIAFPQWLDQRTNAKLIKDTWKTGLKLRTNEKGEVESEEIKKCIELVMHDGKEGLELKKNAQKWKCLAAEALKDGGSLEENLKSFLDTIQ